MSTIIESVKNLFTPIKPLTPGLYHFQSPPDSLLPYRLHLRLEPDGQGMLIVNASTILHLNQTAAELAYHLTKQTPELQVVKELSNRYRVDQNRIKQDYNKLQERIQTLINTPDLDPETFLEFERATPHQKKISAPYRLDCAVTYRLPDDDDATLAPTKRVDRELTTQEWCIVFDQAWDVGIPHIVLTGGEPTLREDLPELISHTEANGQVVGLLTDGRKFTDKSYLEKLLQTGLDHMMFMLKQDDNTSWDALGNVLAADIFVTVHHTLTKENVGISANILDRLSSIGVKSISLSAADVSLQGSLMEVRNRVASLGLTLVWDLPVPYSTFNPIALETQAEKLPEGAGHSWMYVEPDGDVLPAQGMNHVLGNILKDPWAAIWR